jgi:hypothetical protein
MNVKLQRFLSEFQRIAKVNGVRFWDRPENSSMMTMLKWDEPMVTQNVLLQLTENDFLEGPIHQDGYPDAWCFRQNIKGYEVYIKLGMVEKNKRLVYSIRIIN